MYDFIVMKIKPDEKKWVFDKYLPDITTGDMM